jgi:hypothetical protein
MHREHDLHESPTGARVDAVSVESSNVRFEELDPKYHLSSDCLFRSVHCRSRPKIYYSPESGELVGWGRDF